MANIDFPDLVIETARENSNFGKYRFPQDLGPNSIVLDFQKYSYKRTTGGVDPVARTTTSIILPLPLQIQDAYNVIINEAQLGVGGAYVVDQFSSGDTKALTNALKAAETAGGDLAKNGLGGLGDVLSTGGQYAKFLSRTLLDSLPVNGLSLGVDLIQGTAINPHTTLNFDGVNLKQFQFNWQLAPRSEKESEEIKNIVTKIKSHILPKYSTLPGVQQTGNRGTDRALLKYPDLLLTRFNGLAPGHYFEFKPAMVSGMTVDYTPQGPSLLEGGKPAIVNLGLSFTEAQIHTSGKYEQTSENYFGPNIDSAKQGLGL